MKKTMAGIGRWTGHLFANRDDNADSIIFGGILSICGLIACQFYDVIVNHSAFSPMTFGAGCAAILTAIGGGKLIRDWQKPGDKDAAGS